MAASPRLEIRGDSGGAVRETNQARASLAALVRESRAAASQQKASSAETVSAARRAVHAHVDEQKALHAQVTALRQVAAEAKKGSREQQAAADLAERSQRELARAIGTTERESKKLTSSFKAHEGEVSKFGRGALAGSGAVSHLGRSIAFASSTFIGTYGFVAVVKDAISGASDLREQIEKTDDVFQRSGPTVNAWATGLATSFGIATREALSFASTFGNMLVPMGIAPGKAAEMSQKLVELSADVGAFNNLPLADVLEKMRAGLAGMPRPLRTVGVFLDQNRIKAEAYADGLVKATVSSEKVSQAQTVVAIAQAKLRDVESKYGANTTQVASARLALAKSESAVGKALAGSLPPLTQQQKTLAAYRIILKDTSIQQGNFSKTSGDLAQQSKILHAEVSNLEDELGEQLLPAVTRVTTAVTKWLGQTKNQERVQRAMKTAVSDVKDVIEVTWPVVEKLAGTFEAVSKAVGGSKHLIELLLALAVARKLSGWTGALTGLIGSEAGAGTGLAGAASKSALLRTNMLALTKMGALTLGVTLLFKSAGDTDALSVVERLAGGAAAGFALGGAAGIGPGVAVAGASVYAQRIFGPAKAGLVQSGDITQQAIGKVTTEPLPGGWLLLHDEAGAKLGGPRYWLTGPGQQGFRPLTEAQAKAVKSKMLAAARKDAATAASVGSTAFTPPDFETGKMGILEPGSATYAGPAMATKPLDFAHRAPQETAGLASLQRWLTKRGGQGGSPAIDFGGHGGGGGPSYHYSGEALDIGDGSGSEGDGSPDNPQALVATWNLLAANVGQFAELFWNYGGFYKFGKKFGGPGSDAVGHHRKHIHVAFTGSPEEVASAFGVATPSSQPPAKAPKPPRATKTATGAGPSLSPSQQRVAALIYGIATQKGLSPDQAIEVVAAAYAESGLNPASRNPHAVKNDAGQYVHAAGLFQLVSSGYLSSAEKLGGVTDPRANTLAIIGDYVKFFRSHPLAQPGAAGATVEASGEGPGFYSKGIDLFQYLIGQITGDLTVGTAPKKPPKPKKPTPPLYAGEQRLRAALADARTPQAQIRVLDEMAAAISKARDDKGLSDKEKRALADAAKHVRDELAAARKEIRKALLAAAANLRDIHRTLGVEHVTPGTVPSFVGAAEEARVAAMTPAERRSLRERAAAEQAAIRKRLREELAAEAAAAAAARGRASVETAASLSVARAVGLDPRLSRLDPSTGALEARLAGMTPDQRAQYRASQAARQRAFLAQIAFGRQAAALGQRELSGLTGVRGSLQVQTSTDEFGRPVEQSVDVVRARIRKLEDIIRTGSKRAVAAAKAELDRLKDVVGGALTASTEVAAQEDLSKKIVEGLKRLPADVKLTIGSDIFGAPIQASVAETRKKVAELVHIIQTGTAEARAKAEEELSGIASGVGSALSTAAQTASTAFETAFGRVSGRVLTAFDRATQKTIDQMTQQVNDQVQALQEQVQAQVAAIEKAAQAPTAGEAALSALQEAHDAAAQAQAYSDAQDALRKATTPEERQAAQRQLDELAYQDHVNALQKQAQAERAARDEQTSETVNALQKQEQEQERSLQTQLQAQIQNYQDMRDAQRQWLEDQLTAWQTNIENGSASMQDFITWLQGQGASGVLQGAEIPDPVAAMAGAGQAQGSAFADAYIDELRRAYAAWVDMTNAIAAGNTSATIGAAGSPTSPPTGALTRSGGVIAAAEGGLIYPRSGVVRPLRIGRDKIPTHLSAGELVLTATDQRSLAAGLSGGGGNVTVHVIRPVLLGRDAAVAERIARLTEPWITRRSVGFRAM